METKVLCQVMCETSIYIHTPSSHELGTQMKSRNPCSTPKAKAFRVNQPAFLGRLELSLRPEEDDHYTCSRALRLT